MLPDRVKSRCRGIIVSSSRAKRLVANRTPAHKEAQLKPALCTRQRREIVEMVVPPGNHRGSNLRRTCSVRRKVRDPRTPGRTARSAVVAGGSCVMRVRDKQESARANHPKGWGAEPLTTEVRLCHGLGIPAKRYGLGLSGGVQARFPVLLGGHPRLALFLLPFCSAAGEFFPSFFSYRCFYCL